MTTNKSSKIKEEVLLLASMLGPVLVYFFYRNGIGEGLFIFIVISFFLIGVYHKTTEIKEMAEIRENNSMAIIPTGVVIKTVLGLLFFVTSNLLMYEYFKTVWFLVLFDFVLFSGIIFWLFHKVTEKALKEETEMREIASSLRYSYSEKGEVDSVDAILLNLGEVNLVWNVFKGIFQGYPVRIFDYHFERSTSEKTVSFGFTFFELTVDLKLPTVVILSQKEAFTSIQGMGERMIKEGENVNLEGNFSNFFSTRVEVGGQVGVRQILTPDIMAYLIDNVPSYSIIFSNEKLYICCKNFYASSITASPFSKEEFLKNIQNSQNLVLVLLPFLKKYKNNSSSTITP